ncbi:hypothetical protein BCR34DRAFT_82211 [Clohesyomyces aquaticus]|uniref:Uncharacterized protein n=1 Tax=Clohesyomyces aquaticus TaxID=1231657 RepID=A0A1Y1YWP4_9PLEO|nr:hypothetical protein BCR34DRAFT_82211 [Clohesyomyces aquaticus]
MSPTRMSGDGTCSGLWVESQLPMRVARVPHGCITTTWKRQGSALCDWNLGPALLLRDRNICFSLDPVSPCPCANPIATTTEGPLHLHHLSLFVTHTEASNRMCETELLYGCCRIQDVRGAHELRPSSRASPRSTESPDCIRSSGFSLHRGRSGNVASLHLSGCYRDNSFCNACPTNSPSQTTVQSSQVCGKCGDGIPLAPPHPSLSEFRSSGHRQ